MNVKSFNKIAVFLLFGSIFFSCKSTSGFTTLSNGNQIDNSLVGIWIGSEKDKQMEGLEKSWEMNRKKDGTFSTDFFTNYSGQEDTHTETGKWWTENGKYYELNDYDNKTDIYLYEILDENQIKFISESIMSMEINVNTYEFIDKRKVKTSNKVVRDGSSYEKAIKVKSVPEEYGYVRKICQDCKMKKQALSERNGKYYDILTLTNAEGKEVSYYFDISSFFGKFF
ncbi:MAG: hypothetical protein LBT29_07635 [Flavobacteriaceae bacterium]|jgi:hypothetical protein|nr:hypothetical protein [Flavobacteriaceae bacterium]